MSPVDRQLFFASGKLISISEAARNTPYSAEYLSLLARKGKLKAVKISRDWLTTKDAVLEYVQKQAVKHQKMLTDLQNVKFGSGFGPHNPALDLARVRMNKKPETGTGLPSAGERGVQ